MTPYDKTYYPDFFQKIIQITPTPLFIKDDKLKYIFVNDACCTFFGINREEILGKKDDHFFPLNECAGFWSIDCQILSDGKPTENEETVTLQDGKIITIITRKSLIESHGEKFILGIVTDISERTQLLREIKENEVVYKNLIDSLPNLLLIHLDGKVKFANKAILETLGYKYEEIFGMKITDLFTNEKAKKKNGTLLKKFTTSHYGTDEIEIITGYNSLFLRTFLLVNRRINYEGTEAIMSILIDITERKNIETYVLGKIIETEDKDRRRFAADIHDDLGPLISSVRLQLGLLEKSADSSKFSNTSERIYSILDQMDVKIHFITQNIVPREIDEYGLEAAIRELCKTIEQNRHLTIDLISNLDNFRFPREVEFHFYRIIAELLNNSLKHSEASRVFLKMNRNKKMFRIWYSDNGIGYDVDKIKDKTSGIGITNIMYRANLIDGNLNFEKKAGKVIVKISKRLE